MLTTIVPIAIAMEIKSGNSRAHLERFSQNDGASNMFSSSFSQASSGQGEEEELQSEKLRGAEKATK